MVIVFVPKTWGCGTPSKWPKCIVYKWVMLTTYTINPNTYPHLLGVYGVDYFLVTIPRGPRHFPYDLLYNWDNDPPSRFPWSDDIDLVYLPGRQPSCSENRWMKPSRQVVQLMGGSLVVGWKEGNNELVTGRHTKFTWLTTPWGVDFIGNLNFIEGVVYGWWFH